ncbi:MAG: endonuclease III [Thermovenabulum sp.]|uniref:endonuclease III n=1 Tax=Thermovenabulum sp. TaxID=3100335 RepID=UPI003C7BC5B9
MEEKERVILIIEELSKLYPAKTALNFSNPFELLIATILSAQCTDKRVNQVTKRLFKKYKSPLDFAFADLKQLEEDIKELGLYKAKARNIKEASKIIVEKYKGNVPEEFDELIKLPGVGRKTANVVLANAFNKPALAVDTHVFRVSRRLGLSSGESPERVEKDLVKIIPENLWNVAHHLFIRHGREICRARKPLCQRCTISLWCNYRKNIL